MNTNNLTVRPSSESDVSEYGAIFVSVGFESRCVHFASLGHSAEERIAYIYNSDAGQRAKRHQTKILELGYTALASNGGVDLRIYLHDFLVRCSKREITHRRIAVDISSMTRELMALWTYALLTTPVTNPVEIEFVYSHALFSPPPTKVPLAKSLSSITPEFAGMFADSTAPILLILGLGYEPQLALSFLEFLEPAKLMVFEPGHHEKEYTKAIQETNSVFFKVIKDAPIIRYNVYNPFTLFQDLESIIQGAAYDSRVHIAPYGTKLFAISGLMAAAVHYPKVFVWNLKTIPVDDGHDRVASGIISKLVVRVQPGCLGAKTE